MSCTKLRISWLFTFSLAIALVSFSAADLMAQGRSRSRNFQPQATPGQPAQVQPGQGQPDRQSGQRQPGGEPASGRRDEDQQDRSRWGRRGRRGPSEAEREAAVAASRDRVISQLKALDANNNGRLEPTESNPLSIAVFNKVGLDATKSIGFSALTSAVVGADLSRLRVDKDAKVGGGKLEQGVPGFSDPEPGVSPGSFETSKHPALLDKRPLEERYTKEVIAQAKSVMKSYDRNDNLMLDPNEIVLIPWGAPAPDQSDLDKNGYLTEIEICERLAKRTNGYLSSKTETEKKEASRGGRTVAAQPVAEVKKKARPTMSADDRTAKYVRELISKYDENRDGMLDKSEVEKMRAKPSSSIDKDKDENFSYEELYAHYSGGKKATKKASTSTSDLPGNVFWASPLSGTSSVSKSSRSSRSSTRSSSSRGGSSRGSNSKESPSKSPKRTVPAIKFGK